MHTGLHVIGVLGLMIALVAGLKNADGLTGFSEVILFALGGAFFAVMLLLSFSYWHAWQHRGKPATKTKELHERE
jgi:uncharacterized membrane-anchored protein